MDEPNLRRRRQRQPSPPPANPHNDEQPDSIIPILTVIAAICIILFYLNYKPNNPTLSITDIKIPTFIGSSSGSTVALSVSFFGFVANPTRSVFSYSSSSANLFYSGQLVGSMVIPGRRVASGMENVMEVTVNVNSIPVTEVGYTRSMFGLRMGKPTMELELMIKLVGKTTVFGYFNRHVECYAECVVSVVISDGTLHHIDCYYD
ncbi:hypothetical protein SOVF_142330 [Spinacia oleracea]|uniref:Late embryogenesis abundant protein LEA-2 subgroup domain-containing protein n=1 Tax=Spinacia oleracea TaxID=3562 RepID=A0A9R0ICF3_SPIOL|nr:uncharacterized protein LOC110786356 [Spinacia oleracea]KNA10653.1 hypothetical protein SOVF_142330 [Spinacia oleracea]